MKSRIWSIGLAMLAAWSSAHAVVIDETTFKYYGGNPADVANSIKTHNDTLRAFSYEMPWGVVGRLGIGCTATWLGDKDGWSYVLSAAHCVNYKAAETSISETFTSADGEVIATGWGTAYVPPQRLDVPSGLSSMSTDIAILKLPTRSSLSEQPMINDLPDENGLDVIFVGYGSWGVGVRINDSYRPEKGERRLYGRSRIDHTFDLDYGISASYMPFQPSPFWATLASGDDGSAWWQVRDGKAVIIATTGSYSSGYSAGTRVSKYAQWIKSVYPDARFLSTDQPHGCIVSLKTEARYCLPVGTRSGYALPSWIYGDDVYVDAEPGTAVMLSDFDNLSYNRIATFAGTVLNDELKNVRAANGRYLDFSKPHSMRVVRDTTPVGCIVSLTSVKKYCRSATQSYRSSLPSWMYGQEVQVQAAKGTTVMLSDYDNLPYYRIANFTGLVQNWELKNVRTQNGAYLDFSRPHSMTVIQQ